MTPVSGLKYRKASEATEGCQPASLSLLSRCGKGGAEAPHLPARGEQEKVPGKCEEIGFIDFGTVNFQWFTVWITGQNSIFSHVPGTFFRSFPSAILPSRSLSKTT